MTDECISIKYDICTKDKTGALMLSRDKLDAQPTGREKCSGGESNLIGSNATGTSKANNGNIDTSAG